MPETIGTTVVLPDDTVASSESIDLGERHLLLRAVPTAHTDNDLTVLDEATETLFTGDLLFRDLAPVPDGSILGWLAWSETPPGMPPARIVPGHGRIGESWSDAIAPQERYLKTLLDEIRHRIGAGLPMSVAVPETVKEMEYLADDWNSFPESAARGATAAYRELEWE